MLFPREKNYSLTQTQLINSLMNVRNKQYANFKSEYNVCFDEILKTKKGVQK